MNKPDILVLFAEQHRGDCLSAAGHPVLMTPNIDNIGGRGTRFTNAYSSCPICVPARRSLLSGQFPASHGARSNIAAAWDITDTLPGIMAEHGYETAWLGRSMHQHPPQKKFGWETMTWNNGRQDNAYVDYVRRHSPDERAHYHDSGVMHNDWTARSFHLDEHLHHTNWTISEAQHFLERRDTTRPYCMVVSFLAAHPPLIPPAFYMERYLRSGVPDPVIGDWAEAPANNGIGLDVSKASVVLSDEALLSCRAGYYGLINHMDDQIRRLLNTVMGQVDLNNTLVIYTADHGEMLGDHYLWRKQVPYQGSCNIPMLIAPPSSMGLPAGQVLDHPVCLEDIMPSILDCAGAGIPDSVEGRSLMPLLRGDTDTAWREHIHIECAPMHHTLCNGQEKYIWFTQDGSEQFFRLSDDPHECHNLIAKPGEQACIDIWRQRMIATLKDRPEGFSDGNSLQAGCHYPANGDDLRHS